MRRVTDLAPTAPPWRLANWLNETRRIRRAGGWITQFRVVFDYSIFDTLGTAVPVGSCDVLRLRRRTNPWRIRMPNMADADDDRRQPMHDTEGLQHELHRTPTKRRTYPPNWQSIPPEVVGQHHTGGAGRPDHHWFGRNHRWRGAPHLSNIGNRGDPRGPPRRRRSRPRRHWRSRTLSAVPTSRPCPILAARSKWLTLHHARFNSHPRRAAGDPVAAGTVG